NPSVIFRGADNLPYEKVGNREPVCIADEVPFEIPEGWEWVRLGQIVFNHGQKKPETDFCYIDIGSIDNKNQRLNADETILLAANAPSRARKIVEYNDIIYSTVRPYLHNMCIIDREFSLMPIASTGFAVLACHAELFNEFLFYYMMAPDFDSYANDTDNAKGVAYPAINDERLYRALIPLPPVAEQYRIVEKIRALIPYIKKYDQVEIFLTKMNELFPDQLKKSILQLAVQGKLVPQEPDDEPASVLLERIRAEKEQLINEGKIKRDKHESVIYRRDNSHYEKRGTAETCIDAEIPFELPESWSWVRLGTLLTNTEAGKSPQCENRPRKNNEWGVIKNTAVQDGFFLPDENKVLPDGFEIMESQIVHQNDLLITRAGPRNRTGIMCVVDSYPTNLILSDKTVRLSYVPNLVNPHYLRIALSSPAIQVFVIAAMTGMAASQVNISQEKMKTFLVPLPPFVEQERICRFASKLLDKIGQLAD
ncbi:MAG: restriction endonuclease subunit S, partial [Lachnospiraceae bacterium]|nr:restriction endonuclease subunit S [Lachnospiraceae bacterium]